MNDARTRGRRTLLLISLLFAVPIVSAMYLYYSGTAIPVGGTAHGILITPPRLLPEGSLVAEDGDTKRFRKSWSLVVRADSECNAACLSALENIRQIRLSLGPKMTRMQTVFLPATETAIRPELATEHPVLIVVAPEKSEEIRKIIGSYTNGEVFMVDPLGNLMMSYPAGTGMSDIRADVSHLLKLSGIG